MKIIVFGLLSLLSFTVFTQETAETSEEFIPIEVENKEAFISTKTGEYTYRKHSETDPTQLKTTKSGVVYTDISNHVIKKGETLSVVAKNNGVTIADIKKHNNVINSNLKIGSKIKIVKIILIKSSSPVIGTSGDERIIARLRPGELPGALAPPPPMEEIQKKLIKTDKTRAQPLKPTYKTGENIKNPVFGLNNETKETIVKAPKKPVKESKKEGLIRSKAEIKVLETELDKRKESIDVHDEHEGHDHNTHAKQQEEEKINVEVVKPIISEEKETITLNTFENSKKEESLAKKASRVVSQVKKAAKAKEPNVVKTEIQEKLKDTKKSNAEHLYTVEKGDTLWQIAQNYNMTVNTLKKMNNLKNNNISIGQKLKVISKIKE